MKYECYDCSSIFNIDRSNDGGCPSCSSFNVAQYNNSREDYDEDYDEEGEDDRSDEYDD